MKPDIEAVIMEGGEAAAYNAAITPILERLIDELKAQKLDPTSMIDIAAMLVIYFGACRDWQETDEFPERPSKAAVRESLGALTGLLRTLRAI